MARRLYSPNDPLISLPFELSNVSLLDFRKWAFSDLCDDDLKGWFAEWLVAQLIQIPTKRRISWGNSDLITEHGVRIEVKASSFWQSWKLLDEFGTPRAIPLYPVSAKIQIRFCGIRARDSMAPPDSSAPMKLKSQIYVFAFQNEQDIDGWDAMDLSQWEFNVLRSERLEELGSNSIARKALHSEQKPMEAAEFAKKARSLISEVASELNAKNVSLLTGALCDHARLTLSQFPPCFS